MSWNYSFGIIARPYWDVSNGGLIVFNFSNGDRAGKTASEKPCETLLLDVQWKLNFDTRSKPGKVRPTVFLGGAMHSSKVVTDSGSCLIE